MNQKQVFIGVIVLAVLALGVSVAALIEAGQAGDVQTMGVTNFDSVAATTFTGNLVGNVTGNVTGDVTGDATGDVTGNVTVNDLLNLSDTDSTLNGTQTLTPTATFYEFAPTAVLTLTLATGSATVGDVLILQNTVTTNTVVVDTGATVGGGNITLGQNDLAVFIYTNSKWVEIASPDNS